MTGAMTAADSGATDPDPKSVHSPRPGSKPMASGRRLQTPQKEAVAAVSRTMIPLCGPAATDQHTHPAKVGPSMIQTAESRCTAGCIMVLYTLLAQPSSEKREDRES